MTRRSVGTLDNPGPGRGVAIPRPFRSIFLAAKALAGDTVGFRFSYPIRIVPEAGPRESLHYYIYSDRLFFDAMELDEAGVPCQHARLWGKFYNPAYIAWYGLMKLEQSLQQGQRTFSAFETQSRWLVEHAARRPDGSVVWNFPVDVVEGKCKLNAPWISVMLQGLAISVFVRAHRLGLRYEGVDLMELCRSATRVYSLSVEDGGVRTFEDGHVLYEEYPGYPLARVLDGFLFGLAGLYDLWIETQDGGVKRLFEEGVDGLLHSIQDWNYKNTWSWYGNHGYLCPPHYHTANRMLLAVVARASANEALAALAASWNPAGLTSFGRARIFVMYVCLKEWSRVRALLRRLFA
jgi:hypothetical protein